MVLSEDFKASKSEAQPIGSRLSCANDGSKELEQKEKEIVRHLLVAERDKRESMITLEQIKKLNDQYQSLVDDFYSGSDREKVAFDLVLPPTSDIMEQRRKSVTSTAPLAHSYQGPVSDHLASSPRDTPHSHADVLRLKDGDLRRKSSLPSISHSYQGVGSENLSPNISPTGSYQENYGELLRTKDTELRRVVARAQEETARTSTLRHQKEELQKRVFAEVEKWRSAIKEIKQGTEAKEREIVRLSFLAEQDKKTGMFLSQQVSQLKKSVEGFFQARGESKPEHLTLILSRCNSSTDLSSPPMSPLHTLAPPPRGDTSWTMRTALGREMDASMREDAQKSVELARVKSISEQEGKRTEALKAMVEELKQGLVAELQEADDELETKVREFKEKQLAIEKVAARAERERNRSLFLKEEIVKLSNALGSFATQKEKDASKKTSVKTNAEYNPDKAYLSEFSELCDLENPPSSSHASSLPLAIARNLQTPTDPSAYIFSPPTKAIPISPASECIYMQKLKDIAVLNKASAKKDEELTRLKRLAEAERCRHLLLKDKFEELRSVLREKERTGHTI